MTTTVQVQFGGRSGEVYDLQTNEDLVAVRADGSVENLTPAPYEVEVPIRS